MEKEEKGVKKQEFLGVKLKVGALVGKRAGNTTPSPTWRFGLTQAVAEDDSRPQDLAFPSNSTTIISARKLGANLWEVHPHRQTSKEGVPQYPRVPYHKQPTSASDLRDDFLLPMMQQQQQQQGSVERNGHAIPHESPGSSTSMEVSPYRPEITPNGSPCLKGRSRDSSYNLKTSTEFVKVLNRIWSLEEQHASNASLMKAMKKELDHAQVQIRELLKEKKRHHQEMDEMMRHLAEDKGVRKRIEDGQVKDVIRSMRSEVEEERKLRKHSESLHRKLARELSAVKSSYSNALKELERERKARMLLEDLCDEFAKGIRDYEQEMHLRKNNRFKTEDWTTQDRLILHLSEAWLDERMQMKLAESHSGFADKNTIVDKLSLEIETFLKTQKSVSSVNDDMFSSKMPTRRNLRGCSLESFHLNDPGSAPQNGIDEEDFVEGGSYFAELKRGPTPKQNNGSTRQQVEDAPPDHVAKVAKSNHMKKKSQSQEDAKGSSLLGDATEPAETKGGNPEGAEVVAKSSQRKEHKEREIHDDLPDNRTRDPLSADYKRRHENNDAENCFDPSSFDGIASPVEKWTSKALSQDPVASESSSRWNLNQGIIKENTLKAKLLEARLESQQNSSSRASKVIP